MKLSLHHLLGVALAAAAPLAAQATTTTPGFQRWVVDGSRSVVGFDATSTLHDFSGSSHQVFGGAHADLEDLTHTLGGRIWCEAASLDTGEPDRDENMREDLEATRFPRLSFVIEAAQGELTDGSGSFPLSGTFRIHGVDQARSLPITVERLADGVLHVTGRTRFSMVDHGIEPHGVMGVIKVHAEVEPWVDLYLKPVGGEQVDVQLTPIDVEEVLRLPGQEASRRHFSTSLIAREGHVLLDLEGIRAEADQDGLHRLSLADFSITQTWASNDQAFADSTAQMKKLREKYERLPAAKREKAGARIKETIDRLQSALLAAPAEGEVEIVTEKDRTSLRLGQRDWVVLEGLQGEGHVLQLFATLEDLPAAVQQALRDLPGQPRRMTIHAATAAGARDLVLDFGPTSTQALPSWQLHPQDWARTETP